MYRDRDLFIADANKLPSFMMYRPTVLTTPVSSNAIVVHKGKVYLVSLSNDDVRFEEILSSEIEREFAVAFLVPKNDPSIFQGC